MPTKYKSKYTDNVYDKKEDAIADNNKYLSDVHYRYILKGRRLKGAKSYRIPFIKDKRITLSNAGLATGAVLSENMLDSIAKYANAANLPVKTALGLVTKESTLGNPTDDSSVYKVLNPRAAWYFKELGTGQHINPGNSINERDLVNFYKDEVNPYNASINYADRRSGDNIQKFYEYLEGGEHYADKQADKYKQQYSNRNILQVAFEDYKNNPNGYNPGQHNYQQLVNKRANEVWASPEVQTWYKGYRRRLESRGSKTK